ncbi:histidinol-phosphatase HisJ [Leuconostoc holzapfelii]|uniref:Histidinol-phosphatase n=1 Tax=Leuconostoc holzapfelii TaxID=434464 RepID=A0A846ZGZ2_9LACO|nr:histidinol-phosphatase HisJ [Leuconostoc holzapfelii]NKZ18382.1 histidinol-phosphatase HisJ [Leuconostoc holzapfelii]
MTLQKKDGHTHTPYSHQNSNEPFDAYIERAIALGFDTYTITEHAPLLGDLALPEDYAVVSEYDIAQVKAETARLMTKYGDQIQIKRGFEVDYIVGHEREMRAFLRENQDWVDEIVLAVHLLPDDSGQIAPIDYSAALLMTQFNQMLVNPQVFYQQYFKVVAQSIEAVLGIDVPVRIGHLGLVKKFQKVLALPDYADDIYQMIGDILQIMAARGYALEFNAAGLGEVENGATYPAFDIVNAAQDMGVDIVYGSDAHQVSDVGRYFSELREVLADDQA